jgi:hypothetical protein
MDVSTTVAEIKLRAKTILWPGQTFGVDVKLFVESKELVDHDSLGKTVGGRWLSFEDDVPLVITVLSLELQLSEEERQNCFKALRACRRGDESVFLNFTDVARSDATVILEAIRRVGARVMQHLPLLCADRSFILRAVQVAPEAMGFAHLSLKVDSEFVLAVCSVDARAVFYADESIRNDPDFVLTLLPRDRLVLKYATHLNSDKVFVLKAVNIDGRALQHVRGSLQHDVDVCRAALAQNREAMNWVRAPACKSRRSG